MNNPDDILLKVATILGWKDISMLKSVNHYFGAKDDDTRHYGLPNYTTSIDVIWAVYEEFGLYPSINRTTYDGKKYCHVSAFPHHSNSARICSATDANLAMALCKLLIIISEEIE